MYISNAIARFFTSLENVKFQSKTLVDYANKKYKVVFTDKRFILYAQRGHFIKSDDLVSERLDRLNGLEYSEKGLMFRSARISIRGTTKLDIRGPISELKPLFHAMESIIKSA